MYCQSTTKSQLLCEESEDKTEQKYKQTNLILMQLEEVIIFCDIQTLHRNIQGVPKKVPF